MALVQCTFFGNSAPNGSNISADCGGHITLDGCLVTGGIGGAGVYVDSGSSVVFNCTDIWGNPAGDWVYPFADQLDQDGNICSDPNFCGASESDFTLSEASPCAPENSGGCGQIGAWPVGCVDPLSGVPGSVCSGVLTLDTNVPNPFNPATTLRFSISEASHVLLTIYSLDGGRVAVLVDGQLDAGTHSVMWRGRDSRWRMVSSGTYFVMLEAAGEHRTQSMVLLR